VPIAKDSGMMIGPGADGGILGEARPENVGAMVVAGKGYGRY